MAGMWLHFERMKSHLSQSCKERFFSLNWPRSKVKSISYKKDSIGKIRTGHWFQILQFWLRNWSKIAALKKVNFPGRYQGAALDCGFWHWLHLTGDTWNMTCDTWNMTCDTWHKTYIYFFFFFRIGANICPCQEI